MTLISVDDTDPRITYLGGWNTSGVPAEYNSTTHYASSNYQAFTFTFHGTQILVFGTVPENDGIGVHTAVQYVLDNRPPEMQTFPQTQSDLHQTNFFTSPPLPSGQHNLAAIVTSVGPHYFFDFLQYEDGLNSTTGLLSTSITHSTSIASSLSALSSLTSITVQVVPTASNRTTGNDTNHLATISIAVFAPICAVLVAIIGVFAYRGRRRNMAETTKVTLDPFICPAPRSERSSSCDSRVMDVPSSFWGPSDRRHDSSHSPSPQRAHLNAQEKRVVARLVVLNRSLTAGSRTGASSSVPPGYGDQ
ncbi:hypothetical protein PHLGIDRAFT_275426 [Phlebiopsis gigantea 11061_1 CR5-6]|uniref:Transmembrane protein n=1 Tax=Phlebiopsis gigantea (strain 11061_1 CR5-6) TaxID=745531 RepID=A0A0C3NE46_PHLG1|nr:hypothetical protein PHLGIDRAFT_275426 [Phlebiopsis gigantea 11061_1 CR5-6]